MSSPNQPFISICIASYNYGKYLKRGFEAIRKQKFKDYEVIYLDDASRDDSVRLIQGFIRENPAMNISLIVHSENKGLLKTKTELLKAAAGEYVMLCDSDDWMADDCLEVLAKRAAESGADRIISQVYDVKEDGKILQIQDFAEKPSKWLWNLHHGCLYRREIIESNHLEILLYPDDVYLTTNVNRFSGRIEWISRPLYYWLVHNSSAGRKKRVNDGWPILQQFLKISDYILEMREIVREQEKEEVNLLLIKLYYLQIFHEIKKFSLPGKLKTYYELNRRMEQIYPSYLENRFLRYGGEQPARKYAMKVMRLGRFLEKTHVMWLALTAYHFLNKWIEFDQ